MARGMASPRARTPYAFDGERRVAPPIHRYWYSERGIRELNERLRAPTVTLRVQGIGGELPPGIRARFTPEVVRLAREVMSALVRKTGPLVSRHLRNYPLPEFDPDRFAGPTGRAASERYLEILRRHDASFRPRKVPQPLAVPPIVVFGTSRSAESLRMHCLFGRTIAYGLLENQRGSAHADYCLGITAVGAGTALSLLDYWWDGKDAAADHGIQEAYDTLFHETVHRICDLGNPFGPQYGPKGSAKEHYWMEEYEPFASAVERILMAHLAAGRERGILRRRLGRARGRVTAGNGSAAI